MIWFKTDLFIKVYFRNNSCEYQYLLLTKVFSNIFLLKIHFWPDFHDPVIQLTWPNQIFHSEQMPTLESQARHTVKSQNHLVWWNYSEFTHAIYISCSLYKGCEKSLCKLVTNSHTIKIKTVQIFHWEIVEKFAVNCNPTEELCL